jgi:glycolate oxidase iron-sulfur subunit
MPRPDAKKHGGTANQKHDKPAIEEKTAPQTPSLSHSRFRAADLDLCIRCGSCKSVCPTHVEFAHEGMSARGRIELLKKYFASELDATDLLDDRIYTCLLCASCEKSCPRGIPVTKAVYEARRRLALKGNKHRLSSTVVKYAFRNPALAVALLRFLGSAGRRLPFAKMQPFRAIEELRLDIPETRLRNDISVFKVPGAQGRVALFTGCMVDFLYPAMGISFIQALNSLGFEVVLPKAEVCCGAPLLSMGLRQETKYLAKKNLDAFGKLQVDAVISLCPTCAHFIRDVYQDLMGKGIMNATDISKFLSDSGLISRLNPLDENRGKVIYHDPCHTVNHLSSFEEPRLVLNSLGVALIEPAERGCCGKGGVVRLIHDHVAKAITETRVRAYEEADMVVTSCPNCVLQFGNMIGNRPVKHIIELIAAGLVKK